MLYEQIHARIGDRESPSSPLFSHKGALAQTKDILHSTNKATKSVLLHISDSRWWKKTLTGLRPARRDPQADEYDGLNSGFQRQSCHPFYEAVYDKCYTNKVEITLCIVLTTRTDAHAHIGIHRHTRHTHTQAQTHTATHTSHTYTCSDTHTHRHTRVRTQAYTGTHTSHTSRTHMYVRVYIHTRVRTCAHAHTSNTHIHTHTQSHMFVR